MPDDAGGRSIAVAISEYHDRLIELRLPEFLVNEIVLDVARRLHAGELSPEDMR